MFFLINKEKKIIFGWSAKCGCNFVKMMFTWLSGDKRIKRMGAKGYGIHADTYNSFPHDHNEYKIILFIRDPFQRLVSSYVEKYASNFLKTKARNPKWPQLSYTKKKTYRRFVNELHMNGFQNINLHHFTPQLSEKWPDEEFNIHKIYDIQNIDYDYLNELFGIQLPEEIIGVRGPHYINYSDSIQSRVCDVVYPVYMYANLGKSKIPTYEYFYDQELKDKVAEFYKKDLDFFKTNGFDYYEKLKIDEELS